MNAVVFDRCGSPEQVLTIQDAAKPMPKRGEVLVRMIASPVNPSDLMFIRGNYTFQPALPATPGFEGVGVVEASGGGILGMFRKGKRVAVIGNPSGLWAEYAVTTARQVIPVPDDIPDDQAASFFVNPATAVAMTGDVLQVPPGQWLLQTAAGSELGKMIIRLGQVNGYRTINVVRRREQVEELKAHGANQVIVESDEPLAEQVRRIAPEGVSYAIDCVGGNTGSQVVDCLAPGGRMLVFGSLSGEPLSVSPRTLITLSPRIEGFWLGHWAKQQSIPRMLRLFRQVRGLIRSGVARTTVAKEYPLSDVKTAVAHAAQSGRIGKILLRIGS